MFHYLNIVSRLLLRLSGRTRLICVLLIFLCCALLLLICNLPSANDDSLFVIPVALATWLFTCKGAFVSLTASISIVALANTLSSHSILWPTPLTHSFVGGVIALSIEAMTVLYMHYNLDVTEAAMKKARLAEEQSAAACEQQRALNQLKDQFIITVNHELRTPLTEVHGYLELLYEYDHTLQPDLKVTFLQKALHGCEELQVMVNTILDAMQAGSLERIPKNSRPLFVSQLVHEVLEDFAPQHKSLYQIKIDIPTHLQMLADAQYLRQVVRNYVSNAFKYTPPQTTITISAWLQTESDKPVESGSQVILCVEDVGPGIPPAELPSLFSKFFRLARDQSGPIRGTGLGLFVCKQIVESMDGTVWAESTGIPGQGSRFYLSLPGVTHLTTNPHNSDPHIPVSLQSPADQARLFSGSPVIGPGA